MFYVLHVRQLDLALSLRYINVYEIVLKLFWELYGHTGQRLTAV